MNQYYEFKLNLKFSYQVIYGVIDLHGCHVSVKVIHTDQDVKTNVQMISSLCSENTSDISESVKV